MTQRDLSGRQARWLQKLSEYDFEIVHIPGSRNKVADALSRYPHFQPAHEVAAATTLTASIDNDTLTRISAGSAGNPYFEKALNNIDSVPQMEMRGTPPCLYFENRICIPTGLLDIKEKIIHDHHDSLGHFHVNKMFPMIAANYYWPDLLKDCNAYVERCDGC